MSAERFEFSLRFVLKWEGSEFTNDPDDHGGATRFGITQSMRIPQARGRTFAQREVHLDG
jgi:lysozyme family protein